MKNYNAIKIILYVLIGIMFAEFFPIYKFIPKGYIAGYLSLAILYIAAIYAVVIALKAIKKLEEIDKK